MRRKRVDQAIADDGSVTCQSAGSGTVISIDTAGGLSGGPITLSGTLSIADDGVTAIKIADDAVGSSEIADGSIAPVDIQDSSIAVHDVGAFDSIGIGANGLGVAAYYAATVGDLKLAQCADIPCTSASLQTIDATDDVGKFAAPGFDASNRAVIAYFDETNDNLKFAECNNAGCTAPVVGVAHASGNDVGRGISLFVSNSTAVIAHADATAAQLELARCFVGSSCTNGTATILDLDAASGRRHRDDGTGARRAGVLLSTRHRPLRRAMHLP